MKTKQEENNKLLRNLKRKLLSRLHSNYKVYAIMLLTGIISIYVFHSLFHYLFIKNHFDPVIGTEGKTCPACFGSSACPYFFGGEVNIKGIYRLPIIQNYKSRQIFESYHGLYRNKIEVVLKKLATRGEHQETDLRICNVNRYRNVEGKCYPKHALWYYLDYHPSKDMQLSHLAQTRNTAPMTYCVTERLFERIKSKYRERDSKNLELPLSRREEILILYSLNLNQQPLILQLFPSEEGWPFPKYLGACGRWIIEEHVGLGMDNFCNAKLWQKIQILINLLKLPSKLDKSDQKSGEWILYIGDPDPENFMVHPVTFDVKIVDLEHMLVVDVNQLRQIRLENFNEPLLVKPEPCRVGLSENYFNCSEIIDHSTLCSRENSDHNIHSICAMLLSTTDESKGPACLLKDDRLSNVRKLLHKCVYDYQKRTDQINAILTELQDMLLSINKEL